MPLSRRAECPACHAEQHVCCLCRYYDPRVEGQCIEDRAEEVREKERANFCDYFKPRPNAYRPPDAAKTQAAKARLDSLFGGGVPQASKPDPARAKLDAFFGRPGEKKQDSG